MRRTINGAIFGPPCTSTIQCIYVLAKAAQDGDRSNIRLWYWTGHDRSNIRPSQGQMFDWLWPGAFDQWQNL